MIKNIADFYVFRDFAVFAAHPRNALNLRLFYP